MTFHEATVSYTSHESCRHRKHFLSRWNEGNFLSYIRITVKAVGFVDHTRLQGTPFSEAHPRETDASNDQHTTVQSLSSDVNLPFGFVLKGPTVSGLAEVEARTPEEIMGLLRQGNLSRTQQATKANAVSSRSHAVLQVGGWCDKIRSVLHGQVVRMCLCHYQLGRSYACADCRLQHRLSKR